MTAEDFLETETAPNAEDFLGREDFPIDASRRFVPQISDVTGGGGRAALASPAEMGASLSDALSELWQNINTPLYQIPHGEAPRAPFQPVAKAAQILTGVQNSVADTASFFTSPLGIATLGIGMLPKAAQRIIAGAFAAQMGSHLPEVATELGTEMGKPEAERDLEKIANLTTSAATQLGFATMAGKHALTPTPKALKLADIINDAELKAPVTPDEAAQIRLGLPPRFEPPPLTEALRTQELMDRAIQESTQTIIEPGKISALDYLKAQGNEIIPAERATAERIQGGGEAPYGKVSFMREAEAPLPERTRAVTAAEQPVAPATAQEMADLKALMEQGARFEAKPLNPGGAVADLSPELQAKNAEAVAAQKKIAEDFKAAQAAKQALPTEPAAPKPALVEPDDVFSGTPTVLTDEGKLVSGSDHADAKNRSEEAGYTVSKPLGQVSGWFKNGKNYLARDYEGKPSEPAPAQEVKAGNRVQISNAGPQTYTVVERLKQTEGEKANGEQPVRVKNEKTGKEETVLESDLKEVSTPTEPRAKKQTSAQLNEALRKAGLDPSVFPDAKSKKDAISRVIAKLQEAQQKLRGSRTSLQMGVPKAILDLALETVIIALKAGKTVKEALELGMKKVRLNAKNVDESAVQDFLLKNAALESKPTIRVEGEELKTRKSVERSINSDQIPEPVREQMQTDPASDYKVQPKQDMRDVVKGMTNEQLALVPKDSNIYIASRHQLSQNLFDAGKLDEGYAVFKEMAQAGTDFGQNISQFTMLRGASPFSVVKVVEQGLKESGKDPLTKPQQQAVANAANKSIEAGKSLDKAKDDWLKDPTDANAKLADAAAEAAHRAEVETQRIVTQFTPKSWPKMLKAFVQGNPLTPISQVNNVVGNVLGATMEAGSRTVGSVLDQVRTMFAGGERKLAVSPLKGPESAIVGTAKGLKESVQILKRGSGDVVKGEFRQNLQPLRSLKKLFTAKPDVPTVKGKIPINERIRLGVEGVFGVTPEIMLRGLSAADRPSFEAARARLINEASRMENVPKQYRAMAQKFPELFFDRKTLERIKTESEQAVYQNKSLAVSYLESWIKEHGGDWSDLGFTMAVAPYRLTPFNLVVRTLAYNPLVASTKSAYYAAKGNTRLAELNAGRAVIGGLLYTAGYYLYKNGLVGPSLDSRDETKKERLLAGEVLPPNHINVSGLKRLKSGGDPGFQKGDETWDITRGGGAAGAIISTVANIGRDFEKKPEGDSMVGSLLLNGTLEQASFTINQSFLKGVTGILDAVRDRNIEPYISGVESMLMNVASPNSLTSMSRATRKYAPDLTVTGMKNFENLARDRFGVFGLDDYLSLKRDLWGQPMLQTPEGRNAIMYHLFDISKARQVTSDPVALELYDLWRTTANREVIPSIPERQLTVGGKTHPLSNEQYERIAELIGKNRRLVMDYLVVNPEFQKLPVESKIKTIEKAYRRGAEVGKNIFIVETPADKLQEPKKPKAGFKP